MYRGSHRWVYYVPNSHLKNVWFLALSLVPHKYVASMDMSLHQLHVGAGGRGHIKLVCIYVHTTVSNDENYAQNSVQVVHDMARKE